MKKKTSALLLNAFVFPGIGQWICGRKPLALVFIGLALLAIITLFNFLIQQARQILSTIEPGTIPDPAAIEVALRSSLQNGGSNTVSIALTVLVATWLLAVLDVLFRKPADSAV